MIDLLKKLQPGKGRVSREQVQSLLKNERERNQRLIGREESYLHFKAAADGAKPVTGIAVNVTSRGACLRLYSASGLPDQFLLKITSLKICRMVKVVWRDQTDIGVNFIDS